MKLLRVLSSKDLDEINEFLDELKDGDLYKKRLAALEDQKKEINVLIEVVGKVNKIEGLHLKASQLKEGAEKAVEKALADRTSATEEIAAAKAASEKFVVQRNRDANVHFSEREDVLKAGEADLDQREKALARSFDDLATREQKAASDMETAVTIRTRYTEAIASLKEAIASTQRAL